MIAEAERQNRDFTTGAQRIRRNGKIFDRREAGWKCKD
jgi:hypothetical protein